MIKVRVVISFDLPEKFDRSRFTNLTTELAKDMVAVLAGEFIPGEDEINCNIQVQELGQ